MEMVDLCKLFNNDNLLVKEIDFDKVSRLMGMCRLLMIALCL